MESQTDHQLNVIFLPCPAPGHMNPMIDTARLFAKHGASVTIVTTPASALTFQKAIDSDFSCGYHIRTHVLPFRAAQVGVPDGFENFKDAISPEMGHKISRGISMLKDQTELLFQDLQPDCIVTDLLYLWIVDSAAKLGIPRLYFYPLSHFANYASYSVNKYKQPHESCTIPGLPESIDMKTLQLAGRIRTERLSKDFVDAMSESEGRSYGALYNSFHELESDYEKLYNSMVGIKYWSVGPVSAWVDKDDEEQANRGHKEDHAQGLEWVDWLNSKENESVLYVSFGSLTRLPHSQFVELAHGLENSGHNFICIIRKLGGDDDEDGDKFLQDFEERMKESNKGYTIWNWAPQLLILDHPAIGGVVTHCGWNTTLESLSAGLPKITRPIFGQQLFNEMLLTHVLKIAVPVGSKEHKVWESMGEDAVVSREEISKAVVLLMGRGEESKERRRRARKLGVVEIILCKYTQS